ncbi:MAG: bifunctional folylpolyglutamate synthase/dihydrofolate synthase [Bacteroidetes bacterium]|nr:bifunctional folylpolyglutamate synthase/dihydrofolate synthase [Bacteroidota bacterium]
MNYDETLEFLYSALPMYQRVGTIAVKKDLTNIRLLCKALGNPQDRFRSVHIAGTNGKGSSAHMLAAILHVAGYKTGLYTSPHLKNFTERIKINGREIPESEVTRIVAGNKELLEQIKPSFFEMSVAMAFEYFARQNVDIAIVETGLGGRLDSTNILNPEVVLITNISLDHTQMLGNTITKIAVEKGGIIKRNTPVVISESDIQTTDVFKRIASEKNASITFADTIYTWDDTGTRLFDNHNKQIVCISGTNYLPEYQLKNIPGVLAVTELLRRKQYNIEEDAVTHGLCDFQKLTHFKGRWQVIYDKPLTICDTAHNIAGINEVIKEINKLQFRKLHMVWGMVDDKDAVKICSLLPKHASYYFCKPDIPRGMPAERLHTAAKKAGLKGSIIKNVDRAITEAIKQAHSDDLIFIGGSTFVVAEIKDI